MYLDIVNGISVKLNEYFGDEYKIYAETVEQGTALPCFFINHEEMTKKKLLGERYLMMYSFDINYFPQNDKLEMLDIAEKLQDCLKIIKIADGDLIRGSRMRFNINNGVLHFYVGYSMILTETGETDYMDSFLYKLI